MSRLHPWCSEKCDPHGEPGPAPVGLLPAWDANAYPVLAGPRAPFPMEADVPAGYRPDGPQPAPWDSTVMRRPAPVVKPAFPEPLVDSTEGASIPVKAAAVALRKHAEATGWSVLETYAKGWVPHSKTGRPGAQPKESVALRMSRGDQRAVAVYVGAGSWSWDTMLTWRDGTFPQKHKTLGALKEAMA